jgi:type I restriction-modification system DNA methylase subunit
VAAGAHISEQAVRSVRDQESLFEFLRTELDWPIPSDLPAEDLLYEWLPEDLRMGEDPNHRFGRYYQFAPFASSDSQPWGIFLIELETECLYVTLLRRVLRGLVPNRRSQPHLPTWQHDHLLFICTRDYTDYTFAHFEGEKPTAARLSMFGWKPDEPMRTLCEFNLPALRLTDRDLADSDAWLEAWQAAWDVEKVTKAFFRDYRDVFHTVEAMPQGPREPGVRRLVTQRLFNRCLFVYFLQKKHWLRYSGSAHYLESVFQDSRSSPRQENFYRDRLYWLFFKALNNPYQEREEWPDVQQRVGDVPFLNGGLFSQEDEWDETPDALRVPNEAFDEIMDLFRRYNFTVTESTPLDIDVAVDPEMLGRIFEELVIERHQKGSYYTPRVIVSFMCRQTLKAYLRQVLPTLSHSAAARFVEDSDPSELPNPEAVLRALQAVRICDPACGSGAYLVGMMHELLRLRAALFAAHKVDAKTVYERKLEIIQNNLYGGDIDEFAINIAMLRLWLSLVVDDERDPLADPSVDVSLPNLTFKIVRGDTLTAPDPQDLPDLFRSTAVQHVDRLLELKRAYLRDHGGRKHLLRLEIEDQQEALRSALADTPAPQEAVDWRVEFPEVFVGLAPTSTIDGRFAFVNEVSDQQALTTPADAGGGFDIVLTNPPYIRQEELKRVLGDAYKDALVTKYANVYVKTADIYVCFFARAHQLLKRGGVGCFICSSKWLRAGYGRKLRSFFGGNVSLKLILDFGELPVFEAGNFPAILLWQKTTPATGPTQFAVVKELEPTYREGIERYVERAATRILPDQLSSDEWVLADAAVMHRLHKMEKAGVLLGDYVKGQIYYGIKTGCNAAFVIDGAKRAELIAQDPTSAEIIKPLLSATISGSGASRATTVG